MRSILLCFPRHETNVRDVTHSTVYGKIEYVRIAHQNNLLLHRLYLRHIKLSLGLDVGDGLLVQRSVGTVRNDALGVLQLSELVPHFATVPNDDRHTSIDDDIGWNVLYAKQAM